ncbi:cupin domain-containing protein [Nocardia altamirensis]|uniref:cupin domain-containing protein n=1 Tax=Nocardia altamirensis TaxID=472158 RepID=UPI0008403E79|nr:cupin domain-containing protein [Nocardia altamirensis]
MPGELSIASLGCPSEVHGVHGAAGRTQWHSIVNGHGLTGTYEAVEWACVPVGGLSGEHRHSRTEEVYLVLSGSGLMTLNGEPHPVRARDVVLTGLGATHSLRNVGETDLAWLTIEITTARTVELANAGKEWNPMAANPEPPGLTSIVRLDKGGKVDPRPTLEGALREISRHTVEPGMSIHFDGDGAEHVVFVLGGCGYASSESVAALPISAGTAVTTSLGESLQVGADDEMELVSAVFRPVHRGSRGTTR